MEVNNYINPCSESFKNAKKDFNTLSLPHKVMTVALSIFAGLATIFLGGIGGFATFKALVDYNKPNSNQSTSTSSKPTSVFNQTTSASSKPNTGSPSPSPKGSSSKADETEKKKRLDLWDIDPTRLSIDELIEYATGIPLENNIPVQNYDIGVNDIEVGIIHRITASFMQMPNDEIKEHLAKVVEKPEVFALLASIIVENRAIEEACEFLDSCAWPTEDLKQALMPELLSKAIVERAITKKVENKPVTGFHSYDVFELTWFNINPDRIFNKTNLEDNSPTIAPSLAKAIGESILKVANEYAEQFNDSPIQATPLNTGKGIGISTENGNKKGLPPSIINQILPHLPNVPMLKAFNFSDDGNTDLSDILFEHNNPVGQVQKGFTDDHVENVTKFFNSHKDLQIVRVNFSGITSEDEREKFVTALSNHYEAGRNRRIYFGE